MTKTQRTILVPKGCLMMSLMLFKKYDYNPKVTNLGDDIAFYDDWDESDIIDLNQGYLGFYGKHLREIYKNTYELV